MDHVTHYIPQPLDDISGEMATPSILFQKSVRDCKLLQIGLQVCSSHSVAEIEALFVFEPGLKRMKLTKSGGLVAACASSGFAALCHR